MSDDPISALSGTGAHPVPTVAKRPWHSPKLEEVDYSATELGIGVVDASDIGTGYGSQ